MMLHLLDCFDYPGDPCSASLADGNRSEFQVHQSGINSLSVWESEAFNESEVFIGTGGDDGSLHILQMSLADKITVPKIKVCCRSCQHSSQVSGLSWLSKNRICSVAIDQRLIVWKFEYKTLDEYTLDPLFVLFCSVPDIQGLRLFKSNNTPTQTKENDEKGICTTKLFVYGSGVQVFDVPDSVLK